jgi:hypothetical protein
MGLLRFLYFLFYFFFFFYFFFSSSIQEIINPSYDEVEDVLVFYNSDRKKEVEQADRRKGGKSLKAHPGVTNETVSANVLVDHVCRVNYPNTRVVVLLDTYYKADLFGDSSLDLPQASAHALPPNSLLLLSHEDLDASYSGKYVQNKPPPSLNSGFAAAVEKLAKERPTTSITDFYNFYKANHAPGVMIDFRVATSPPKLTNTPFIVSLKVDQYEMQISSVNAFLKTVVGLLVFVR